ncbi:porphobilinogen synthase [Candidatus Pantoea edessiphila]|uniref:Delta-aminolevulinic acid dehydratase n=1 Tax=Candidatus Pantoea edessiphila TaxID=2044610 RepID=A0A2P5SXX0_9GAMM|nr:porphobilinogen synthase [Candidatus Pantoea edessiphila]MBK4775756.1 porphobilinogen synthase [Pantoea sp. Edef]PPI87152.1 porphobilinogen synthase [Candidatus Pantoea edessiphila]
MKIINLAKRPRRLRVNTLMRRIFQEFEISINKLALPIFVEENLNVYKEIDSMPGVMRIPEKKLAYEIERIANAGINIVLLFGISHHNDPIGSDTWDENGLLSRIIRICKNTVPEIMLISDICFCQYTTHGHCGVIYDNYVDNDQTLVNMCKQSVVAAAAGADFVAPSASMDGQVCNIRRALDLSGFNQTAIISYSTKFASSLYGPFRDAAKININGDRNTYQINPINRREAIRESLIDVTEGADVLMVKPAGFYLDILRDIREKTEIPLAAYQVSGEYSMIKFAAKSGVIDEYKIILESLAAIKRAGADIIFSYFTLDLAEKKII